jgi:hypothetical protein
MNDRAPIDHTLPASRLSDRATSGHAPCDDAPSDAPFGSPPNHHDHWEMFAEAMDLTIDGHRLIAQEIVYESRLLWRGAVTWFRDLTGALTRGRASPRV